MTKRFSEQFKQEALNFVQSHPSLGIATIAKQLGVGYSTLDNWIRQHRQSIGSQAATAMSAEQQRIRALEKQVAHLTEVNDILKKAHVYFINNPSR
jgi:transposase